MSRLLSTTFLSNPKYTEDAEVFERYMRQYSPQRVITQIYDHWVENNLPRQIEAHEIEPPGGGRIRFKLLSPILSSPTHGSRQNEVMTPRNCREKHESYTASLRAQVTYEAPANYAAGQPGSVFNIPYELGAIPVMLRSKLCVLGNGNADSITPEQILTLGENPDETGGYFIIDGGERSILVQEKLRVSISTLAVGKKHGIVANSMTCLTPKGTTTVIVKPGRRWQALKVGGMTMYLEKNKTIPLYMAFSFLGYSQINATDLILNFVPVEHRMEVKFYLQASIAKSIGSLQGEVEYVLHRIAKNPDLHSLEMRESMIKNNSPDLEIKNEVYAKIQTNLFSHIPGTHMTLQDESGRILSYPAFHHKARMLAIMAAQMALYQLGHLPIDDRDSWANKRLDTPGRMLEIKMNTLWKQALKNTIDRAVEKKCTGIEAITSCLDTKEIWNNFQRSFTNSWSEKRNGASHENITDSLKRETPAAVLSQIPRVSAPTSRHQKMGSIRDIQDSQFGYICVAETPENKNCGLVKTMGVSARVSTDQYMTSDIDRIPNALQGNYGEILDNPHYQRFVSRNDSSKHLPPPDPNVWRSLVWLSNADSDLDYHEIVLSPDDVALIASTIKSSGDERLRDIATRQRIYKERVLMDSYPTPIILNGTGIGFCSDHYAVEQHLQTLRRFGYLHGDICISYQPQKRLLEIFTEGGRMLRPLWIVERRGDRYVLPVVEDNAWKLSIDELLRSGYMEMIDAREFSYLMITESREALEQINVRLRELPKVIQALTQISELTQQTPRLTDELIRLAKRLSPDAIVHDLNSLSELTRSVELKYNLQLDQMQEWIDETQRYPISHCELHGVSIYGTAGALIPGPEKIQGPRVTYQCAMIKQALNGYHPAHEYRMDTSAFKCMTTPMRNIFEPHLSDVFGLTKMPSSANLIKCFWVHPDNGEDGIIINQDSIHFAHIFQIEKYTTHRLECRDVSAHRPVEVFQKPSVTQNNNAQARYHAIQADGTPRLNEYLKEGDCVIGRVRRYEGNKEENASLFIGVGEEGYVRQVTIGRPVGKGVTIKVKIVSIRDQQKGDKLASRFSQKGVITKVLPSNMLPRVASGPNKGMVADIYVNPASIPSRMPISETIEMLVSKAALYHGSRINATAFERIDIEYAQQILRENGLAEDGTEEIEVPIMRLDPADVGKGPRFLKPTGEYRLTYVRGFMAPCATQALRHHSEDKYQVRSRGNYKPDTHQPVAGRGQRGGQRWGEMERDAVISAGAADIIQERLMTVSDAYRTVICRRCGYFARMDFQTQIATCTLCNDPKQDHFGVIEIPCAFRFLMQLLNCALIHIKFHTQPVRKADVSGRQ